MIKEGISNVCDCCLGRWYNKSQCGIMVGSDKYVQSTLCPFEQWSHKIHCAKV